MNNCNHICSHDEKQSVPLYLLGQSLWGKVQSLVHGCVMSHLSSCFLIIALSTRSQSWSEYRDFIRMQGIAYKSLQFLLILKEKSFYFSGLKYSSSHFNTTGAVHRFVHICVRICVYVFGNKFTNCKEQAVVGHLLPDNCGSISLIPNPTLTFIHYFCQIAIWLLCYPSSAILCDQERTLFWARCQVQLLVEPRISSWCLEQNDYYQQQLENRKFETLLG